MGCSQDLRYAVEPILCMEPSGEQRVPTMLRSGLQPDIISDTFDVSQQVDEDVTFSGNHGLG